ncbi:MAG: hypothetical protein LIP08_13180 [Bacteroides sp.]|nr:hypothetical protein [Bacteroides sp.]
MRTRLICILILFLIYWPFPLLHGQTGKFYSPDKELSNSLVNQIYQDNKGFIWIATENGLNKFDGNRFTIYRHHPSEEHALKNNYVRTIFEDSRDRFWIGCINGLQRYDRATDQFYNISIARPDGRIDPHITSIVERHNGDLWITTSGQGILSLKNGKTEHDFQVEYELTERIQSIYINVIFEDSAGFLWIATEDKGLFRYSPETDDLQAFTISRNKGYDEVSALCEDEEGNILAGTLTGGCLSSASRTRQVLPRLS